MACCDTTSTRYNITCKQAVDLILSIAIKDLNSIAIDITDWVFTCKVRSSVSDEVILTPSVTIADAVNGVATLRILAADTAAVDPFIGFYDVIATRPDDVVVSVFAGNFELTETASR